jgi:hypothetical protein
VLGPFQSPEVNDLAPIEVKETFHIVDTVCCARNISSEKQHGLLYIVINVLISLFVFVQNILAVSCLCPGEVLLSANWVWLQFY